MSINDGCRFGGMQLVGFMVAVSPGAAFSQYSADGHHGGNALSGMSHYGGVHRGQHHYGTFSGSSLSHYHDGFHGAGWGAPPGSLRNPIGYSHFGVGSLRIGFGVPDFTGYGGYGAHGGYSGYGGYGAYSGHSAYGYGSNSGRLRAYTPYNGNLPSYSPYMGSVFGYQDYSRSNSALPYSQPRRSLPPQSNSTANSARSHSAKSSSAQPPRVVSSSSDLRPGMVLPDGAVVISVAPVK